MAGKKCYYNCNRAKRQTVSRSTRAELQFPVSRVDRMLRQGCYSQRLSSSTPVFLAGVLEYLTANILDQAAQEAHCNHKMRIAPEHVEKVLERNQQLYRLLEDNPKTLVHEMVQDSKK